MISLGIDIGTTAICGIATDIESGNTLKTISASSGSFLESKNAYERCQDADHLLTVAKSILDGLIDEFGASVSSIGITGQMHGILYFDEKGSPVSPLYSWQDKRGDLPYGSTTYAEHLGSFTGYGNVTDFFNRENGLVPKDAVGYSTVYDFFAMSICSLPRPLIHQSSAASLGLFDLKSKSFNYPYKDKIADDDKIIGCYRGIPVAVAIGDNQASVLGSASFGDVIINVGTGSQVSVITEKNGKSAEGIELRPYVCGKYLAVGAALCGGRAYATLAGFYKRVLELAGAEYENIYALMGEMLDGIEKTSLKFDTRLDGTRANPEVRGSISNISSTSLTPENLTLATLYGMAEELHNLYEANGEKRFSAVGCGGGIRKNARLKRVIEDLFGIKLKIPLCKEEAAFGASLYAAVASGSIKSFDEAAKLIHYENSPD